MIVNSGRHTPHEVEILIDVEATCIGMLFLCMCQLAREAGMIRRYILLLKWCFGAYGSSYGEEFN